MNIVFVGKVKGLLFHEIQMIVVDKSWLAWSWIPINSRSLICIFLQPIMTRGNTFPTYQVQVIGSTWVTIRLTRWGFSWWDTWAVKMMRLDWIKIVTLSALLTKPDTCTKSVDSDETAHIELSHQDLYCLPFGFVFWQAPLFALMDMSKFSDGEVRVESGFVPSKTVANDTLFFFYNYFSVKIK